MDLVLLNPCVSEIFAARLIGFCSFTVLTSVAGSLGHVTSSDQWVMNTSDFPGKHLQPVWGSLPCPPPALLPFSVTRSGMVESLNGGWLPGAWVRIVTQAIYR